MSQPTEVVDSTKLEDFLKGEQAGIVRCVRCSAVITVKGSIEEQARRFVAEGWHVTESGARCSTCYDSVRTIGNDESIKRYIQNIVLAERSIDNGKMGYKAGQKWIERQADNLVTALESKYPGKVELKRQGARRDILIEGQCLLSLEPKFESSGNKPSWGLLIGEGKGLNTCWGTNSEREMVDQLGFALLRRLQLHYADVCSTKSAPGGVVET